MCFQVKWAPNKVCYTDMEVLRTGREATTPSSLMFSCFVKYCVLTIRATIVDYFLFFQVKPVFLQAVYMYSVDLSIAHSTWKWGTEIITMISSVFTWPKWQLMFSVLLPPTLPIIPDPVCDFKHQLLQHELVQCVAEWEAAGMTTSCKSELTILS